MVICSLRTPCLNQITINYTDDDDVGVAVNSITSTARMNYLHDILQSKVLLKYCYPTYNESLCVPDLLFNEEFDETNVCLFQISNFKY